MKSNLDYSFTTREKQKFSSLRVEVAHHSHKTRIAPVALLLLHCYKRIPTYVPLSSSIHRTYIMVSHLSDHY